MAKYPVAKRFGRWALLWFCCTAMLLVPALLADILGADLPAWQSILLSVLAAVTSFLMLIKFGIMLIMLAAEWFGAEVDEAISHQGDD